LLILIKKIMEEIEKQKKQLEEKNKEVPGTGKYYYRDPNLTGLVSTEDMVVMLDEMGIETGIDVDRLLEIGEMNEKIVGRRLRSETIKNGRIPKGPTGF